MGRWSGKARSTESVLSFKSGLRRILQTGFVQSEDARIRTRKEGHLRVIVADDERDIGGHLRGHRVEWMMRQGCAIHRGCKSLNQSGRHRRQCAIHCALCGQDALERLRPEFRKIRSGFTPNSSRNIFPTLAASLRSTILRPGPLSIAARWKSPLAGGHCQKR